jgi:hypothetical protein
MGTRVREHIRGNIVAYISLFFAMSLGTAYAIDKNEIKSKHIAKDGVKSSDIGAGQVKNADLAADAVDGSKVAPDSLTGADVQESSLDLPASPGSLPPSGQAGGDLAGEYPNPTLAPNAVSAADIDTGQIQQRIGTSCGAGQFFSAVGQDGAATCTAEPGDISAVNPGTGMTGGAASGAALLGIANGGVDSAQLAADLDDALGADDIAAGGVDSSELNDDLDDTVNADDIATDGVGSAEVDDASLDLTDLAIGLSNPDSIDFFGTVNNGACSGFANASAYDAGSAPSGSHTMVVETLTDGWRAEGTTTTSAAAPRIRVCNESGVNVEAPEVTFYAITFGP